MSASIGSIVKNAIPLNSLKNQDVGVEGTYAMGCYGYDAAKRKFIAIVTVEGRSGKILDVLAYDVVHSVSGRQKSNDRPVSTEEQGVYPSTSIVATVSIAHFLTLVNSTYKSILSEDVLHALGEVRPDGGYYSDRVRFSKKKVKQDLDGVEKAEQDAETADEMMDEIGDDVRLSRYGQL